MRALPCRFRPCSAVVRLVRVEVAARRGADAGHIVVADDRGQRAVLAEAAERGDRAVRRVEAVGVVHADHREVLAAAQRVVGHVVVGAGAVAVVDQRVGEADRHTVPGLLRQRLDARDHRGGERGAADPVLAVLERPVREGLRLADEEAGVRVGDGGDVGLDALPDRAAVGPGERVGDDAALVERLRVQLAGTAARAGGVAAGEGRPARAVLGQRRLQGAPAGLPLVLVALADGERGAAHGGDPGGVRRGVDLLRAGPQGFATLSPASPEEK